jgi:hypothetical protein
MKQASKALLLTHIAAWLCSAAAITHAQEDTPRYLVSVQDNDGTHLCNGSYIGEGQVLMSATCSDLDQQPWTLAEQNSGLAADGVATPFPLPGYPSQVRFTLADGSASQAFRIQRQRVHPFSGGSVVAEVEGVADGAEAIALASQDEIEQLENAEVTQVWVVGRYQQGNEAISATPYAMQPVGSCFGAETDPLSRELCLSGGQGLCQQPIGHQSSGAAVVHREAGRAVLVGMSQVPTAVLSCQSWAASSRYKDWLSLLRVRQQGLSLASAYDMGEQVFSAAVAFDIEVENTTSDQSFDLSDIALAKQDGFAIEHSNCTELSPGQRCTIGVTGAASLPQQYHDQVTVQVNGERIGTYVAASYKAHAVIAGDGDSGWSMVGWTPAPNASVAVDADIASNPVLMRDQVAVNPRKVSITYRAPGTSNWHMFLNISRQGLYGDGVSLMPANVLRGTSGQWVTREFNVTEPGIFRLSIAPGLSLIGQSQPFVAEVAQICIDECDG